MKRPGPPRAARKDYLDQYCGDDAEIRAKVEELLIELDNASSFPEIPFQPTEREREGPNLIGVRIGSYRILNRLGRGGMGEVFLAERADGAFHKQVAIKLLPPDGALSQHSLRRFLRERQILALLEHNNIARLLDGGSTDGCPYVVMEYVAGQSLREVLKQNAGLPANLVVKITRQICDGLHAAHRNGIIHRDIKPENIMVAEDGAALTVKILDFGIARSVQPMALDTRTKPGMIKRTGLDHRNTDSASYSKRSEQSRSVVKNGAP